MPLPESVSQRHVVIIAGEESGDQHAAHLARALLKDEPSLILSGIGGRHMQEAGVQLISDLARFGVTGISEVIKHAVVIKKAFTAIKHHLKQQRPDLLVLVDYPGFNLRLARFARQLGIRTVYYISPQIWAWKAGRIRTIRENIDRMAVILPFEKEIYQQAGVPVSFVGHPLVNKIPDSADTNALRTQLGLPLNKKLIALLPGSRRNEIERHMPVLAESAARLSVVHPDWHFVIPIAKTLNPETVKAYVRQPDKFTFLSGQSIDAAACSDCVVVASGTASLECALLLKPMCIIYKVSMLTAFIAKKLVKVRYLGLCNLLQNDLIVPELLQNDCNPDQISSMLHALVNNRDMADEMQSRLKQMKQSLSAEQADCSILELVKEELELVRPAL
ncbi:lipid-A-disaccharide synthase [Legionella sp. CNM-4043-24]|uniref:lipid-A-disaccharide synthase n=1 Tax=Legionella sp. CNM-4043-24 TaxID=3421646 RepID=UPI00403B3404